jgi:Hemerythrin HHE cation binding domain
MKATEVLHGQHGEIRGLFKRINGSNGMRHGAVALDLLIARLRLHTRLEEAYFYPAIQTLETKKAGEAVLESYEEHNIVDYLMGQLPLLDLHDERFLARVRVLQSLVEDHVLEEEKQLFPMAERLGDEALATMGKQMAAEIAEVQHLDDLIERAAVAARRTESWAARMLSVALQWPRRALRTFAPSRFLRIERRRMLVEAIAERVPSWMVNSVYDTVARVAPGRTRESRAA